MREPDARGSGTVLKERNLPAGATLCRTDASVTGRGTREKNVFPSGATRSDHGGSGSGRNKTHTPLRRMAKQSIQTNTFSIRRRCSAPSTLKRCFFMAKERHLAHEKRLYRHHADSARSMDASFGPDCGAKGMGACS